VELVKRWSGPISVAVFAYDKDAAFVTDAIASMQECWPEIRKRTTFHLVYPVKHMADITDSKGFLGKIQYLI
jgi:hypothetical protein